MIADYIKFAINGIKHRKLRSWLTMIGIFIGIAAVVSLISLGNGMRDAINEQFEKMGADKIVILAGGEGGGPGLMGAMTSAVKLTKDDLEIVKNSANVKKAAGMIMKNTKVEFKRNAGYAQVIGLPVDETKNMLKDIHNIDIKKGVDLEAGDDRKVVIGYKIADDFFSKSVDLRNRIFIQGKKFEVIGILERIGNDMDDSIFIITIDAARDLFNEPVNLDYMLVETREGVEPVFVAEQIKKRLRREKNEKEGEESFQVQTSEQLLESVGTILDIVNGVLIAIAAISLFVGAVGIMNTMYTSVLERTRQIGIMKAIGARNSNILFIFLVEAGVYGLIGGLIGAGFGFGMAKSGEYIVRYGLQIELLKVRFDIVLIGAALLFSTLLGMISGALPARQASKLAPVDALRRNE